MFLLSRRPDLPSDPVPPAESVFADQPRIDIDVFPGGEIVVRLQTQKAVLVGENFQNSLSGHAAVFHRMPMEDFKNQLILQQAAWIFDPDFRRLIEKLLKRHFLQIIEAQKRARRTRFFRCRVALLIPSIRPSPILVIVVPRISPPPAESPTVPPTAPLKTPRAVVVPRPVITPGCSPVILISLILSFSVHNFPLLPRFPASRRQFR